MAKNEAFFTCPPFYSKFLHACQTSHLFDFDFRPVIVTADSRYAVDGFLYANTYTTLSLLYALPEKDGVVIQELKL